ncbi:hypothetical protein EVAR_53823_1 [Eumeta japonica]|uniref:Uncharacterized protein n=1 Tax=Eumeta variegata TaxID=151549 RepID=A0A4C1YKK3_EUMVA|nr:hypothetical protein EVAR_53823_1 [Eumeta japonica]
MGCLRGRSCTDAQRDGSHYKRLRYRPVRSARPAAGVCGFANSARAKPRIKANIVITVTGILFSRRCGSRPFPAVVHSEISNEAESRPRTGGEAGAGGGRDDPSRVASRYGRTKGGGRFSPGNINDRDIRRRSSDGPPTMDYTSHRFPVEHVLDGAGARRDSKSFRILNNCTLTFRRSSLCIADESTGESSGRVRVCYVIGVNATLKAAKRDVSARKKGYAFRAGRRAAVALTKLDYRNGDDLNVFE